MRVFGLWNTAMLSAVSLLIACGGTSPTTQPVPVPAPVATFQDGLTISNDIAALAVDAPDTRRIDLVTGAATYRGVMTMQSDQTSTVLGALNLSVGFFGAGPVSGGATNFVDLAGRMYRGDIIVTDGRVDSIGERAVVQMSMAGALAPDATARVQYDLSLTAGLSGLDGGFLQGDLSGQGTIGPDTFMVTGQAIAAR